MGTFSIAHWAIAFGVYVLPLLVFAPTIRKAGFSPWWVLLALVPVVGIAALWFFAYAEWPAQRKGVSGRHRTIVNTIQGDLQSSYDGGLTATINQLATASIPERGGFAAPIQRVEDIPDSFWGDAAHEFATNRSEGLWAKAFALCEGDERKAQAMYIRERALALTRSKLDFSTEPNSKDQPSPLDKAVNETKLPDDIVAYLGTPILSMDYLEKYNISEAQLHKAFRTGQIKGALHDEALWVQDKVIS